MNSQPDLFYLSQLPGNRKSLKYYFLLMDPRMCSEVLCILCNVMIWWCSGYQIMRPSWWSAECHGSNNTKTNSSSSILSRSTNWQLQGPSSYLSSIFTDNLFYISYFLPRWNKVIHKIIRLKQTEYSTKCEFYVNIVRNTNRKGK